ncbi:mannosyl-3-phosphoglycerate phosphatase [Agrobacterium albertimagni AOL15]|uniref:Mannosyl-3-phosphoglycerate phosphatase n=1 Tax=Agrobacterium albertimagni AOL15 TaxID=1156935 RepID=K2Q0J1_9HYPH|nr:HAD-IIB family hydrolase [Agrobacterium albertimagni]EKF58610.1 mannosyl-3-phosphoglycerate phosphatase [Agrobacterium albertimagni AOL15]
MKLVFTDLDGTLLDHDSYSFEAARPALDLLASRGIPVILASSKTEAEMRPIAEAIGIGYPMIVENGAGVVGLGADIEDTGIRSVSPYSRLRDLLRELPKELSACFEGFGDWDVARVASETGLPLPAAERARQRRFSEPGRFTGTEAQRQAFIALLEAHGFTAVQGGRFFTLMPKTSKAARMAEVVAHYQRNALETVRTVALGDAPNDLAMLEASDCGIIIANPAHSPLPVTQREREGAILRSEQSGPKGWNIMIHQLVATGFL